MSKYNESEPYSFGGSFRLVEYVGKNKAEELISKSDIYTRFEQHRKPKSNHQFMYITDENFANQM